MVFWLDRLLVEQEFYLSYFQMFSFLGSKMVGKNREAFDLKLFRLIAFVLLCSLGQKHALIIKV